MDVDKPGAGAAAGEHENEEEAEGAEEMEREAELGPHHRAEALDVLAGIELKLALLRERVYVEKMEALAWEEGLIEKGASFLLFWFTFGFKGWWGGLC